MMEANRATEVGWSPMPGKEIVGGAPAGRTRSIMPERAHQALTSKPGLLASSPTSP